MISQVLVTKSSEKPSSTVQNMNQAAWFKLHIDDTFPRLTNKSFQQRSSSWRCAAKQIISPKETKALNIQWFHYWKYQNSAVSFSLRRKWLKINPTEKMLRLRFTRFTGNKTFIDVSEDCFLMIMTDWDETKISNKNEFKNLIVQNSFRWKNVGQRK